MYISNGVLEYLNGSGILKVLYESSLPAVQSFRLSILISKLKEILTVYQIEKTKLLEKYGNREGQDYVIPRGKIEEFEKEFNNLLIETVKVDLIVPKINVNDLNNNISAKDIAILKGIIEFYKEDN